MVDEMRGLVMTCGFCFCGPLVLLTKKIKPDWQAGLLNGVGGKLGKVETPVDGMVREFLEETGVQTLPADWRLFATEREPFKAWVYFFVMNMTPVQRAEHRWPVHNDAGESLHWLPWEMAAFGRRVVGNLSWLLPLAQDPRQIPSTLFEPKGSIVEMPTW